MRGSERLKGVLEINKETKSILIKSLTVYNIMVAFIYWYKGTSLTLFFCLSTLEIIAFLAIFKICAPLIVEENGNLRLVNVVSVNAPGPVSFCWDVMFWTLIGKALVAFSWKWFIVYLGIPVSFFAEFLYKPYRKLKKL